MPRTENDARQAGRYRKIKVNTWGDEKFRTLSKPKPNGQTLWFHLLTGPHTTAIPGLSSIGEAGLAESVGNWTLSAFRKCWEEIASQGMAEADWTARVVWLPHAIEHNEPESPNVVKSWIQHLIEIPECPLKNKAIYLIGKYLVAMGPAWIACWVEGWEEAFREAMPEGFGKAFREAMPEGGQTSPDESGTPPFAQSGTGTGTGTGTGIPPIPPRGKLVRGALESQTLTLLNTLAGTRWKPAKAYGDELRARIAEGVTPEDLELVVQFKVMRWKDDDKMREFLTPKTLFRKTNFERYIEEARHGSARGPTAPDVPKGTKQTMQAVAQFLGKPEDRPW